MGGGIYIVGWVLSWSLSVFEVNNPKKSRMGYREYVRRTKSQGDERGGGSKRNKRTERLGLYYSSFLLTLTKSISVPLYLSLSPFVWYSPPSNPPVSLSLSLHPHSHISPLGTISPLMMIYIYYINYLSLISPCEFWVVVHISPLQSIPSTVNIVNGKSTTLIYW